jgi:hypothetical protein
LTMTLIGLLPWSPSSERSVLTRRLVGDFATEIVRSGASSLVVNCGLCCDTPTLGLDLSSWALALAPNDTARSTKRDNTKTRLMAINTMLSPSHNQGPSCLSQYGTQLSFRTTLS